MAAAVSGEQMPGMVMISGPLFPDPLVSGPPLLGGAGEIFPLFSWG